MAKSKSRTRRAKPSGNRAPVSSPNTNGELPDKVNEANQSDSESVSNVATVVAEPSNAETPNAEPSNSEVKLNHQIDELIKSIGESIDSAGFSTTDSSHALTEHTEHHVYQDHVSLQLDSISEKLEQRVDGLFHQLESKLEAWLTQLQAQMQPVHFPAQAHDATTVDHHPSTRPACGHDGGTAPATSVAPQESEWDTRKRKMLTEIGLSTEEIEQIIPPSRSSALPDEASLRLQRDTGAHCVAVHIPEPIESVQSSEEIEQLKEQLNEKLREAEVELAINRARLSKEWASLEQQKATLVQREADWRSRQTSGDGSSAANTKKGILDRFARHMTKRNEK